MEQANIDLPLDYWNKRKEFLKQARLWFCFGKVRMIKKKHCCTIIFYHNTSLFYMANSLIHFGAYLHSKGYRTYHNDFNFKFKNKKNGKSSRNFSRKIN